jgi:polar amino acid transport system substrate-binding protein
MDIGVGMKIRNGLVGTLCVATAALALTGCSQERTSTAPKADQQVVDQASSACSSIASKYPSLKGKTINVGSSPGQNYYDFVDEKDPSKVIGLEPDLVNAVGKCAGFTVKYQKIDFDGLIPALSANRIDLITSGMYATPERAKKVNFVSYMKAAEAAVVRKGNPKKITGLETLCGTTVAQVAGTVEVEIAAKEDAKCKAAGKPAIKFLNFTDNNGLTQALSGGRADVFLTDAGVAAYLAKQFASSLEKGFDIVSDFKFGIGVSKNNADLLGAVNDGLTALYEKGELKTVATKWGFSEGQLVAPQAVTG